MYKKFFGLKENPFNVNHPLGADDKGVVDPVYVEQNSPKQPQHRKDDPGPRQGSSKRRAWKKLKAESDTYPQHKNQH